MKKIVFCVLLGAILYQSIGIAGEVYIWTDKNGNTFFSDSPPPSGSFKKRNIENEIDKVIEQKKDIEKKTTIDAGEKVDQKIKLEIEYQKKIKSIRDYDAMRQELRASKEKYQKKYDELERQWDTHSSNRYDINREIQRLNREYRQEIQKIKDYFGYY